MDAEKKDESTAKSTEVDAAATADEAAHESAESKPVADKPAAPAKVDTSKMSTVDILRAKKEERQSRAKDTTTATKSTNGSDAVKSADEKAEVADAEASEKADLGSKDKSESGESDDELLKGVNFSKPGWFDSLKPEQREALDRKYPGVSTIANHGKAEATRHIENAKKSAAKLTPAKDDKTPTADNGKEADTATDLSEAIDLLYDPKTKKQGLTKLFSDPDAAEIIDARVQVGVKSALKGLGIDLDEQVALQPLNQGIELASTKYPQLKTDDSFFDEVVAVLEEDAETYEALSTEKNSRLIAAAIREAAATVVRSRAAKKPATATTEEPKSKSAPKIGLAGGERRDNLERTTQAAREQAGMKAGAAGSRTSTGGQAPDPESTVELLRRTRQGKDYRFIGGVT